MAWTLNELLSRPQIGSFSVGVTHHLSSRTSFPFLKNPSISQVPSRKQKSPRGADEETLHCGLQEQNWDAESPRNVQHSGANSNPRAAVTRRGESVPKASRSCPRKKWQQSCNAEPQTPDTRSRKGPKSLPQLYSLLQVCRSYSGHTHVSQEAFPWIPPPATASLLPPGQLLLSQIRGNCLNNSFNHPIFLFMMIQLY